MRLLAQKVNSEEADGPYVLLSIGHVVLGQSIAVAVIGVLVAVDVGPVPGPPSAFIAPPAEAVQSNALIARVADARNTGRPVLEVCVMK